MMNGPKDLVVFGCSGDIGAGKDTVAKLMLPWGFRVMSFAEPMKHIALQMGWDGKKDDRGRKLLQLLGTEVGRVYDLNTWINKMAERIESEYEAGMRRFVIPDCRFENEMTWVVKKLGGKLLYVRNKTAEAAATKAEATKHSSEQEWKRVLREGTIPFTELDNSGTIPETFHNLYKVLTETGVRLTN